MISHGILTSLGSIGWGDGLVLAGVVSFVFYTLGAAEFRDFSPLRYTALTASLGWLTVAGGHDDRHRPRPRAAPSGRRRLGRSRRSSRTSRSSGAVVAVVSWNAAAGSGPQNAALFGRPDPVTTFVVEISRGYRPASLELVGAAIRLRRARSPANLLARRPERVEAPDEEFTLARPHDLA